LKAGEGWCPLIRILGKRNKGSWYPCWELKYGLPTDGWLCAKRRGDYTFWLSVTWASAKFASPVIFDHSPAVVYNWIGFPVSIVIETAASSRRSKLETKMQDSEKPRTISPQGGFTIYDAWERFGITKHWGTINATRRLIKLCNITPGQYILDIGCGTGYTACLLAKECDVDVIAADSNSRVLEEARKRITKENVDNTVKTIEADAHKLPFSADTFDAVIAESVLAFCDKKKVSSEVYRVLKAGGAFGNNEGTWLKPPPVQMTSFLSKSFGMHVRLLQEDEWKAVYREVGFEVISSTIYPFNYIKQFFGELRVDGIGRRLSAWLKAFSDPAIRRTIFKMDRETRRGLRQFLSYVGYGLYVSRKV